MQFIFVRAHSFCKKYFLGYKAIHFSTPYFSVKSKRLYFLTSNPLPETVLSPISVFNVLFHKIIHTLSLSGAPSGRSWRLSIITRPPAVYTAYLPRLKLGNYKPWD